MLQNKSIKLALIISVFTFILLVVGSLILNIERNYILYSFIFTVIVFAFTWIITHLFLYNKFDKLYRTIDKVHINPSAYDFKKAEQEIEEWVKDKKVEIQNLKTNEKFRKEFIGNLAHELKTPVFSSQGYILTLLEGGLEDENINLKFLKKASNNIDRISEIIKDMDTISKIESSNLELEISKVELIDLIQSVFEEFEDKAQKKEINLELVKNQVNEIFVLADKRKIKQVFNNLVLNSIFYGKKDGFIQVILSEKKGKIEVEIKDNGIGISEENIPRLFERFYRVEKSRDRNKGGSGIGLAIVKHIIDAHGETVFAESEIGVGTSFHFTLKKG